MTKSGLRRNFKKDCGRFTGFGGGVTRAGYKATLLASMVQILLIKTALLSGGWAAIISRSLLSRQLATAMRFSELSAKICRSQRIGAFAALSIGVGRRFADPFPMTIERVEKLLSVIGAIRIQKPNSLFLDKERLLHRAVIAGETNAMPRRIISAAEIRKFDCHSTS